MLMAQFTSISLDQEVHFVFQVQFLLFQRGFLDQVLLLKEMVGLELLKFTFELMVFL